MVLTKGGDGREVKAGGRERLDSFGVDEVEVPRRKAGLIPMSLREKIESSADASGVTTPLTFPS